MRTARGVCPWKSAAERHRSRLVAPHPTQGAAVGAARGAAVGLDAVSRPVGSSRPGSPGAREVPWRRVARQRDTRAERERARVYQARQAFHAGQARRRTRDNLIAGVGGGLLILAIVAGQVGVLHGRSRRARSDALRHSVRHDDA